MRVSPNTALGILIGMLAVAACGLCVSRGIGAGGLALLKWVVPDGTSEEHVGDVFPSIGSAASPGSIPDGDFKVTILSYGFSGRYAAAYGIEQNPAEGAKFLWLKVAFENTGLSAAASPSGSHFGVVFGTKQIGPDGLFLGRPGYSEYEESEIPPGDSREGWLRFSIPAAAQPPELMVVYTPGAALSRGRFTWALLP